MKTRGLAFVLLVFAMCLTSAAACRAADAQTKMPQRLSKMLNWLPADTETLVVTNGPFEFPDFVKETQTVDGTFLWLSLFNVKGQQIEVVVEGSRRFRAPLGFGMMPYEGCHLIQFKESSEETLTRAMKECFQKSDDYTKINDYYVAVFKERLEDDHWTLYLTHPRPGLLLCATHRGYLEDVLNRMEQEKPGKRALPASLPEWKHVDFNAPVWALRHYRKDSVQQDPTSPLREKTEANVPDPKAVGVVFSYDANKKAAKVLYLSTAKNAVAVVTDGWHLPSEGLTPKIQLLQPGVVEVSEQFKNQGDVRLFLFVLMGYLGHAVFV